MKEAKRVFVLFWISVGFLLLMSATILLMPIGAEAAGNFSVAIGLVFWISASAGYILLFLVNVKRINMMQKSENTVPKGDKPGVLVFFSNTPALTADIMLFSSFLIFIILRFTELKNMYISYIFLFLLIFSLNMHCVFNGRIYKFVIKVREMKRL